MSWEKIKNALVSFASDGGIKILKALLILIIGILVVKIIMKILKTIFAKTTMEKITQSFLLSILKFALNMILIITVVQSLGIATTSLIAVISAMGLAVGLALQGSLSNLANGIVIITTKPFKEGDMVNINGTEGMVKNIKMLTTAITTLDNKIVILPNSTIVTNQIINYNARKTRRVNFDFDVDYATDVTLAKKIITDVMLSDGRVLLNPAPFVALKSFKDSSISFFAYCWCDSEDYWGVFYYITETIFNEFKRNKISIPFAQSEVRLRNDKVVMPVIKAPLQKRVEKQREEDRGKILADFFSLPIKHKDKNNKLNNTPKNTVVENAKGRIVANKKVVTKPTEKKAIIKSTEKKVVTKPVEKKVAAKPVEKKTDKNNVKTAVKKDVKPANKKTTKK